MMRSLRPGVGLALAAAFAAAALLGGALAPAPRAAAEVALATTTTVAVSPPQVSLGCDATKLVDIRINDVTDLYGVDVKLTFDPAVVEVVDANASAPGVQIQEGNFPDTSSSQGLVQTNSVDTATGTISYVAVRLNPAEAQTGSGVIASITFKAKASGTSAITLSSVMLSNDLAQPIQTELLSGQITVSCDGAPTTAAPTATKVPGGKPKTPRPPATKVPDHDRDRHHPPSGSCSYVVQPGDTLYSIARRYGTTVDELAVANHIRNPNAIFAGQTLLIPRCTPGDDGGTPPGGQCFSYVVQVGDTLSGIAWANCDTVAALAVRNGILNPDIIRAGQVLTVCPGCQGTTPVPQCRATHVVQPCETLYGIALRYGANVYTLATVNSIANPNLIYAGQTLCIP